MSGRLLRVLHISDVHLGRHYVPQHVAAAEKLAAALPLDAIVISGDLSQRARVHEFRAARVVLDRFAAIAPIITVPGNHDTAWWNAPFGLGSASRLHARFRALIQPETEPTVRLPGLSMVGLNSAAGMLPRAITLYPRHWRVKGALTAEQLDGARTRLAASPAGDLRILVLHHNVLRGRLSKRWGLRHPETVLDALGASGADIVCAGHDHEERVELV
jgi:3',5'-cyclic AMP phosphodiesterase CpdA